MYQVIFRENEHETVSNITAKLLGICDANGFSESNFRPKVLPMLSCPAARRRTWEYIQFYKRQWETIYLIIKKSSKGSL